MSALAQELPAYPFFTKLTALPFVDAVYLYGSHARGDADARSDINLAIYCPEATHAEWQEVQALLDNAEILLRIVALRWDSTPDNAPFKTEIDRDKTLLFARNPTSQRTLCLDAAQLLHWNLKVLADAQAETSLTPDMRARALTEHFRNAVRSFWRMARRALAVHGLRAHSPLSVLKHAHMQGWLEDRKLWEALFADWQQLIPHGTAEVMAHIEQQLPRYVAAIEKAAEIIQKEMSENHA